MKQAVETLIYYLLERGFLDRQSLVDGDVIIASDRSRHQTFAVVRKHAPSYFIKQIQDWQPDAAATLRHEGNCYTLAATDSGLTALGRLMPTFYAYDAQRNLLITELLRDSENLAVYHKRRGVFPIGVASLMGRTLGSYHKAEFVPNQDDQHRVSFRKQIPWILSVHQSFKTPPFGFSGGNARLLEIVNKYQDFSRALDFLREKWEYKALIHGDMKWENCVVYPRDGDEHELNLKVVDWEVADLGDPYWDVGAILNSYIMFWIFSLPAEDGISVQEMADKAQHPIEKMQAAIRAFWQAYCEKTSLSEEKQSGMLEKCIQYAAARLIQTAFEHMVFSPQLSGYGVLLLQVSRNIFEDPAAAVRGLLTL